MHQMHKVHHETNNPTVWCVSLITKPSSHNKALIPKTTYLSDQDYIMRILYKNCYESTVTPCCGTVITHVFMLFAISETFIFLSISLLLCMYIFKAYIVFYFVDYRYP